MYIHIHTRLRSLAMTMLLAACQAPNVDSTTNGVDTTTSSDGDGDGDGDGDDDGETWGSSVRQPYVDDWEVVGTGAAALLSRLSIGDRLAQDNFANRGDIEVRYVDGIDEITIEMQRFTIATSADHAEEAFSRMQPWLYDLAVPEPPSPEIADLACWAPGTDGCHVRAYYDGLFQPVRDGANFRVTIPAGWSGELELVTADNLEEGIEDYPDRSDILVAGLAGSLSADLDSGNVQVELDPSIDHYAGCPDNDACVQSGHMLGCGCVEPTNIVISNLAGNASNMTIDVNNTDHWYTAILENRANDPNCTASIDCEAFADCVLDPDYVAVPWTERGEINFPGGSAIPGAGIRISLISEACGEVPYVNGPQDYESPEMPVEQRGNLRMCAGCLEL